MPRPTHPYTYIRTWQGWLYLAVVLDLFWRRVVGWATAATIHRELVLNAVLMAVRRRRPRGTLIHSDQGTQFGSDALVEFPGFSGDASIRLLMEERCQSRNIRFLGECGRPTNSSRRIATSTASR